MTPDTIAIIAVGIALGGMMLTLLQRLDKRIDGLDKRIDGLDKRIDGLDKRIGNLEKEVVALKATVETFFRVRIDPPPPDPESHDRAA
ncbi:MAG: hypothetical protein OXE42_12155 [Gammaproteobacteria bacterium]|nr:hypothetical protein [Gammaproteobacteria bacterium]